MYAVIAVLAGLASSSLGASPDRTLSCAKVTRALFAGQFPRAEDLTALACPAKPLVHAFDYDVAAGVVRARRDLAPGEVVVRPPSFALAVFRPGDRVRIVSRSGPVTVQRDVEAVAPARDGQNLFVKGSDGKVFQVRFSEARR
jgi:hypothetical protein